jgi:hypothetical protein
VRSPSSRVIFPINVDSEDIENSSFDSLMVMVSISLHGGGVTGRRIDVGDCDFLRRGRFRREGFSDVAETSILAVERVLFFLVVVNFCTPASIGCSKKFSLLM